MNENVHVYGAAHASNAVTAQRNQVLRNTDWLLALSMLPGVPVLLGFTFFMRVMLSRLVGSVLGLSNGAIFFGMATLSSVIKRDLSSMGK
jgi:modulator of FtsH protease